MRLVFVRHGHPDYERDCLTELGHLHAEAAAERLMGEGIERIFSSSCGRARETAEHLAAHLRLPVEQRDFMREIRWGSADGEPIAEDGHPWTLADRMVERGEPLLNPEWMALDEFRRNRLLGCAEMVATETDAWLQGLGYAREGLYYRAGENTAHTIAVFGHGGASAAMLSHLFNLPFPFVCAAMGPDYTGITVVSLPDRPGELIAPRFEIMNDARHIRQLQIGNVFGR